MRESLRFAFRTPVAALSSMAPKLPPSATRSLRPRRGFLVCGHLSSFTAPSHWCRSRPYSLSLFFLFSFALPRYVGSFLPFGRSEVFCKCSAFCGSCSTCRCISDVFVGRKVISMSYSSAILKLLSCVSFWCLHKSISSFYSFIEEEDINHANQYVVQNGDTNKNAYNSRASIV